MKKFLAVTLLVLMAILPLTGAMAADPVKLTIGSWRADDVAQWKALLAEYAKVAPGVEIEFLPTNPPEYNAALRLQLEGGTGPDLMFARSYATGLELFNSGYFADVTDLTGLKDNYTADALAPWTTTDGKTYAVPFIAVSHAVYYNKDIFEKEGLQIPTTFEDFLKVCEALKAKGITPLANGVKDEWDILECFFLGMLPNYVGGSAERAKYESGDKKLNEKEFVEAFTDIAKVAPYLPDGYESVGYNDSQALFNTQQAAMFMDGSWTISAYDGAPFKWGVFAMPAPTGKQTGVCFHIDAAMAVNPKSTHLDEAKAFLAWMASKEGATLVAQKLPAGMFPVITAAIDLPDEHANEFLKLNDGKVTDVRFIWPQMVDLYKDMNQVVIKVIKGEVKPQEGADSLAAMWPKK